MPRSVRFSTSVLALVLVASCAGAPPSPAGSARAEAAAAPLPATGTPAALPPGGAPEVLGSATIAAVGDLLLHGAVKESAEAAGRDGSPHGGYAALFAGVREELAAADVGFANLETPVAARPANKPVPFVFNAPEVLLPALRETGIDLVSFANNHVYDQGVSGFAQTLDALARAGLPALGAGRTCEEAERATIVEANGIRLAFLAATKLYNDRPARAAGDPCSFALDETTAIREAKRAREAGADLVILSIHWGVEYRLAPRQEEIDQAHRLLDAGVEVILGRPPHVLQPVEVYRTADGRDAVVAYSLGNFISNQSRTYVFGLHPDKMGHTRDGVILRFRAVKRRYASGVIRTELADLSVQPLWTENNAPDRARDPALPPVIRVVAADRAAEAVRAELAKGTDPVRAVELEKRLLLYETRRRIAASVLGEDLLR